jgi:hypothetical protein
VLCTALHQVSAGVPACHHDRWSICLSVPSSSVSVLPPLNAGKHDSRIGENVADSSFARRLPWNGPKMHLTRLDIVVLAAGTRQISKSLCYSSDLCCRSDPFYHESTPRRPTLIASNATLHANEIRESRSGRNRRKSHTGLQR